MPPGVLEEGFREDRLLLRGRIAVVVEADQNRGPGLPKKETKLGPPVGVGEEEGAVRQGELRQGSVVLLVVVPKKGDQGCLEFLRKSHRGAA